MVFADPSILLPAAFAAIFIGLSKSGIANTGLIGVILLFRYLPYHFVLGFCLPLLLFSDAVGVFFYGKYLQVGDFLRVMRVVVIGLFLGVILFQFIEDEKAFKRYIAIALCFLSCFKFITHYYPEWIEKHFRKIWRFVGFLGGMLTMSSHTGGPFISLGLLFRQHSKEEFLGLYASMFFCINLIKVPVYLQRGFLNLNTLAISTAFTPFVLLGGYLGYRLLPHISKEFFNLITIWIIFCISLLWLGNIH